MEDLETLGQARGLEDKELQCHMTSYRSATHVIVPSKSRHADVLSQSSVFIKCKYCISRLFCLNI
jgi:hypothetical protein